MDKRKDIIMKLKVFKERLSDEIPIEKMIFFGSVAHGRGKEYSDIDLIIVSPKFRGVKFRERPLSFYKYWQLNLPFDFLCYTPEEFKERKRGINIVREAVKTGIAI